MGARSERQPITSCHYFLPSTQKHETLRNIFLAQVQLSLEYHMAKGSSLSEVRLSEHPLGLRQKIFSVVSPVGEPQVAEGKLSVLQGVWDITHRERSRNREKLKQALLR